MPGEYGGSWDLHLLNMRKMVTSVMRISQELNGILLRLLIIIKFYVFLMMFFVRLAHTNTFLIA